jgi:hypothetical protein
MDRTRDLKGAGRTPPALSFPLFFSFPLTPLFHLGCRQGEAVAEGKTGKMASCLPLRSEGAPPPLRDERRRREVLLVLVFLASAKDFV